MLLSLKNLQKNYPGFSLDVSMEVEEGQITGLIGANGAGKSTTFKVILGLVHPDAGEIRLFNKDMEQISQKEKADIGATLSDSGFSNCLTVKQIVHILTETYEKFDREMFEKRCSLFSIPMDKKLKEFSTGMKAKLKVLTATSFDARLLVLDEPTAMLDPAGRHSVLEAIDILRHSLGMAVIYITHHMEEVLCSQRVVAIKEGSLFFDGTPEELFKARKIVEELSLEMPLLVQLINSLNDLGYGLPMNFSWKDTADNIVAKLRKNVANKR